MPRKEHLENLLPNRFYDINATVKYIHRGQKVVTGIIQQENSQSRIIISDKNTALSQGTQYNFAKCFYSNNGWIYAKNPEQSIQLNEQTVMQKPIQLKQLFQNRVALTNKYFSIVLYIVAVNPTQTFNKHGQELKLNVLTGFGNGLMININLWNYKGDLKIQNQWVIFEAFKMKITGPDSFQLNSSVYSKIKSTWSPEEEQYNETKTYKNLSSYYQERSLLEINSLAQYHENIYSFVKVGISNINLFEYLGCKQCRRKIIGENCQKCGQGIDKENYIVLNVELTDGDSTINASVFDANCQQKFQQWNGSGLYKVNIKSKVNKESQILRPSNVITKIQLIQAE